ncbi:metallophosphoesterase, partial [uncultured Duncaniella sp.]|uniref:metallophosphoesterase family protein n=1 Tax=uncultured Duncaniella sp. TaxID=2768039 RepID=UPI00341A3ECF
MSLFFVFLLSVLRVTYHKRNRQHMKFICTGDWHLGNMFHGIDRLDEQRHFLDWMVEQIEKLRPDALLIAGDVFD